VIHVEEEDLGRGGAGLKVIVVLDVVVEGRGLEGGAGKKVLPEAPLDDAASPDC
jgi:hypothetical protein